jgi:predicted metal-binding membrane protein
MGDALEALLRRDRAIVTGGLVGMAALAWLYLFRLARPMAEADTGMAMPQMQPWGPADVLLLFVMWAVMMVAMMVPSAAPVILVFTTTYRRRREREQPVVGTGVFLAGYLAVWTGYAALASLAQWGLHRAALLSETMASASALLGGGLLIAAGVFQWTPLKHACLARCRSPLAFVMSEWREGAAGALVMGLRHGAYCLGCCWLLMALLFVAGVMNLAWVAGIAAFVLVEKVVPGGEHVGRVGGVALALAGLWLMARG